MKYFAWLALAPVLFLAFVASLPNLPADPPVQWEDPTADWDDTIIEIASINPSLAYWLTVDLTTLSATELNQGADQVEAARWIAEGYVSDWTYLQQPETAAYWQSIASLLAIWADVMRSLAVVAPDTGSGDGPPPNDDGSGSSSGGTSGSGSDPYNEYPYTYPE